MTKLEVRPKRKVFWFHTKLLEDRIQDIQHFYIDFDGTQNLPFDPDTFSYVVEWMYRGTLSIFTRIIPGETEADKIRKALRRSILVVRLADDEIGIPELADQLVTDIVDMY